MAEPITLQQAKDHLRVVIDDEDSYITSLITAARQMAEARTQRALVPREEVLALDCFGMAIRLPWPPLTELTSIEYLDQDGEQQTLAPETYVVNDHVEPARITRAAAATWPAPLSQEASVLVSYTAGYADAADVPAPLVQWMLLAIGGMYENREPIVIGATVAPLPEEFMCWLWQPYVVYM